jgi:hypothetical protein
MRKGMGQIIAAGAFLATVATSAHAGGKVLWTPPALASYPSGSGRTIFCDVVNVGTTPQDVTIEILDYFGAVVTSVGPTTLAAESGTAWGDSGFSSARCRFTVTGSTKKIRAMAIYDNGTDYTVSVPAQ